MIEYSNLNLNCEGNMRITLDKVPALLKSRKTLKPKLRTTMTPPRQTTFRQALLALLKRNLGGNYVASPMNYKDFAKSAFEKMMDVLAVDDWRAILASMDKIRPDEQLITEWEKFQNPSTLSALERMVPDHILEEVSKSMDDYEFILKAAPKAATDAKPVTVYPTVQTVMFHNKRVNAFFGPLMREANTRLLKVLRPEVLFNKGKNLNDIELHLSATMMGSETTTIIENDFSDYDRSQKEVAFCLDEIALDYLGLNPDDLDMWMSGHYKHSNINFSLGLKVNLMYQRKSGDVTTAFLNTVLNMTALVFGLNLGRNELVSAMFLGDDSWLQLKKSSDLRTRVLQCSTRIAVHFNGEAKTAYFNTGYFCGYYILNDAEGVKLAADPIKRSVKLGRWDVKNIAALKENWISFGDLMRNYDNEIVQEKLAEAVVERTPLATYGQIKLLVEALNSLKNSYKEFRNMYDSHVTTTVY
uniref:Replicase large subunit n=1 Tax=Podosphaera prunicola tobamo-like virus TaxID=2052571 RepID=A0A2P9JAN0_9VIRU|nr:RNA-dependent RNA polymerase [Podosphaera prunicola tobamo-like virus]